MKMRPSPKNLIGLRQILSHCLKLPKVKPTIWRPECCLTGGQTPSNASLIYPSDQAEPTGDGTPLIHRCLGKDRGRGILQEFVTQARLRSVSEKGAEIALL